MKPGCGSRVYRSTFCKDHYDEYLQSRDKVRTTPVLVACPDDLIPLVDQLAENDARPIFTLLWRAIGNWHLQGIIEEGGAT